MRVIDKIQFTVRSGTDIGMASKEAIELSRTLDIDLERVAFIHNDHLYAYVLLLREDEKEKS